VRNASDLRSRTCPARSGSVACEFAHTLRAIGRLSLEHGRSPAWSKKGRARTYHQNLM
jgi:hypothetical protein